MEELVISALRVDVKPWAPDSNKAVFFEEAFSNGVFWKVCAVREADGLEDYLERVFLLREYMLDAEAKLARRSVWLGFHVRWARLVQSTRTVALDMEREALLDVC